LTAQHHHIRNITCKLKNINIHTWNAHVKDSIWRERKLDNDSSLSIVNPNIATNLIIDWNSQTQILQQKICTQKGTKFNQMHHEALVEVVQHHHTRHIISSKSPKLKKKNPSMFKVDCPTPSHKKYYLSLVTSWRIKALPLEMFLHKTQVEREKNWTITEACYVLALSQNAIAKDP
jgi:hypothetical protein